MVSTPSRCSEPSTTCSDHLGTAGDPPSRLTFDGIDVPPELGGDHDLVLGTGASASPTSSSLAYGP